MPIDIQKKYSFEYAKVASLTVPPNMAISGSSNSKYTTARTMPASTDSSMAFPILRSASSGLPRPRLRLTKAQQPSPIITAMASATTVSGKTTVFAALP